MSLSWKVVGDTPRMSNLEHEEFMRCYEHLKTILNKATSRKERDFTFEVESVFIAACIWADKYKRTEPKMGHVMDADSMAAGHVDWCTKFPLYVAELVYDVSNWAR
jgi:hypothetical protein